MKQFFYLFKSKKKLLLFTIYFIVVIVGIFISYKGAYSSIPKKEMILMKSKDPEMGIFILNSKIIRHDKINLITDKCFI